MLSAGLAYINPSLCGGETRRRDVAASRPPEDRAALNGSNFV